MLELKGITKVYELGKKSDKDYQRVDALKGVDIKFRKSEFVSILGPSGCGKTTLLNIVGGLDKYTNGDLIINGKSTKDFSDKEWDSYRNHSIGFVFQSYNLIPHQSVLQNVEIALTLSGVKREERKKRAIEVLKRVGLEDKINAKPNQLSGGQMQRVAIARALVNNPDVILADEPTGALDSKTSVQIMDLLKEISKDKLIIMVTHNPDLAETYSSRIIKLKDGELISDSNPFAEEIETTKVLYQGKSKSKKTSMSYWSALSLSFKNLLTKKARTFLVSLAGSIGIIGIALILALSSGFQMFINKTQEDTLSNYPITINQTNMDPLSMLMSMFTADQSQKHDIDGIYASDTMSGLFEEATASLKINDLKSFSEHLEANKQDLEPYLSAIQYTYALQMYITSESGNAIAPKTRGLYEMIMMYTSSYLHHKFNVVLSDDNKDRVYTLATTANTTQAGMDFVASNLDASYYAEFEANGTVEIPETVLDQTIYKAMKVNIASYKNMGCNDITSQQAMISTSLSLFNEMIDNQELIKSQYELLGSSSKWATTADEAMLVLSKNSELDDYYLYILGLISEEDMKTHMDGLFGESKHQIKIDYNSVIGKEYKVLTESDYWYHNGTKWVCVKDQQGKIVDEAKYQEILADPTKGKTVKIVGAVRLNEETESGQLSTGIAYTSALTQALLEHNNSSDVVNSTDSGTPNAISLVPTSISFYASSFEAKEKIEEFINAYNSSVSEEKKIEYTDYVGLIMSSVSSIINAISYILIGFVSVSLVVSSIMIGIITYISVLERIKEIGILRAVGASKKDVKRVFTAETIIIGFVAGVIGILTTLLLTLPINMIIKSLTDISGVAKLPIMGGVILVLISIFLTFIAGLIPAKIASKKDPVVALRTE